MLIQKKLKFIATFQDFKYILSSDYYSYFCKMQEDPYPQIIAEQQEAQINAGKQEKQLPECTFLVIGRSGAGKSALCRTLTADDNINIDSGMDSCTKQCAIYESIDILNQERCYKTKVIDTPGLDASDINSNQSIAKIIQVLQKVKTINAILFVISHSSPRDQTMGWLLKFLIYLFTVEKLNKAIVPILTHFDQKLETNPKVIQKNKSQRQKAIKIEFMKYTEQQITFWQNHMDWINIGDQVWSPEKQTVMQQKVKQNISDLINKMINNKLKVKKTIEKFQTDLRKKIIEENEILQRKNQYIKKIEVNVPNFKSKVEIPNKNILLRHINFAFGLVLLIRIIAKEILHQQKPLSNSKANGAFASILDKIHCDLFLQQISKRITVRRHTPIMQNIFSYQKNGYISLQILPKHYIDEKKIARKSIIEINEIKIKSIIPLPAESCRMLDAEQLNIFVEQIGKRQCQQKCKTIDCQVCNEIKIMVFMDKRNYKQEERHYQFSNVVIFRPDNQYYNKIFLSIIQN